MRVFQVTTCTVTYETYEIEAETPEQAEDNLWCLMDQPIDQNVAECDIIETLEVDAKTIEGVNA